VTGVLRVRRVQRSPRPDDTTIGRRPYPGFVVIAQIVTA